MTDNSTVEQDCLPINIPTISYKDYCTSKTPTRSIDGTTKTGRSRPLDESHTPKNLTVHTGSIMKVLSATELADELRETKAVVKISHPPQSHQLPESRVLVLYTGGTIGMKTQGGVYSPMAGYLPEVLRTLPPLNDKHFIDEVYANSTVQPYSLPPVRNQKKRVVYWIVEYDPLLDSCDMTFDDWIRIATDIKKAYHHYDGFVVLHGTDTLAYTASALSFMMENLGKPVIITGSQIPVAEVRSDGMDNLIGALITAGNLDVPEVCVYFNNKVMRGNRTTKLDNSALDAFVCPNMHPLIQMNINIKIHHDSIFRSDSVEPFDVHDNLCRNVGMLRIFPSMSIESVRAFLAPPTQGVILQTFGAGNMPTRRSDIIQALKEAIDRDVLIVNCTQCLKGQVDVHYATGKILYDIGIIPGSDMTSEAAMAKMCYVLGKDAWDYETKKKMLTMNLRGEMTVTRKSELKELEIIPHIAKYLRVSNSHEVQLLRDALLPPLVCHAAKENNIELLECLRESGAHFAIPDYNMRTPLHVAATYGNIAAVNYLLKHGTNVHTKDMWGCNALLCAIRARNIVCVEAIRKAGGVIDGNPKEIGMELCLAASLGDLLILKCFAAAGTNMREEDYDGRNALHLASSNNLPELVAYLLEIGLDPHEKDHNGTTSIDEAQKKDLKKIEEMLLNFKIYSRNDHDGVVFTMDDH